MQVSTLGLFLAAFLVAQTSAFAQDTGGTGGTPSNGHSPADDLGVLLARAGDNPEAQNLFEMVRRRGARGNRSLTDTIVDQFGFRELLNSEGDLPYSTFVKVQAAGQRAEKLAVILSNDLDGDGSVTRQEIADTLTVNQGRRNGAAEILIMFDADKDDILSPDEIRSALQQGTPDRSGRDRFSVILRVLDFDDDGILTSEELARAEAALKSDAATP